MDELAVKKAVDDAVASGAVEGANVLITGDVEFSYSAGTALGVEITDDSVWWVASITKSVVAVAAMQCVERGTLDPDASVSDYIPSWSAPRQVRRPAGGAAVIPAPPFATEDPNQWELSEAATPMTVRHLLTSTSGLQTIGVPNLDIRMITPDDTLETFVDSLASVPLDFEPGERWHYSNATSFEVLARLVEIVSGQPFAEYVRAEIFDPLGMDSIDFGLTARNSEGALPPHPFIAEHPMVHGFPSGSAGLFGTSRDIARFAEFMLGIRQPLREVLTKDTLRQMTTNQIGDLRLGGLDPVLYGLLPDATNPGVGYGYGVLTVLDSGQAGTALPEGSFGWDGIGARRWWGIPAAGRAVVILAEGDAAGLHREVEKALRG